VMNISLKMYNSEKINLKMNNSEKINLKMNKMEMIIQIKWNMLIWWNLKGIKFSIKKVQIIFS